MSSRLLPLTLLLCACKPTGEPPPSSADAAAAAKSDRPVLLFLGDSLTAGYGVALEEAYPALIGERRPGVEIRNAGVSGSTTAGVLETLDWNLAADVDFVFLAIGANDGLRGLDLKDTRANIEKIIDACKTRGVPVALGGMRIPPNYGDDYAEEFAAMYPSVAKSRGVPLMPFLLDGVGGVSAMNQGDGIHPNEEGHAVIAQSVEAFLEEIRWLN